MQPHSLYIHIPFCKHRCGYCDFNTYAKMEDRIPAYVQALIAEISYFSANSPKRIPLHTVYFGGGTPSLVPAELIEKIMRAIEEGFDVDRNSEVTLEANPGTVDEAYFARIRAAGINRLSIGIQSANYLELQLLERQHGYKEGIEAVKFARQAGFENISIDLIFGLPYQTLGEWQNNLHLALGLHPDHISLYALTLEHGTPLAKWVGRGLLPAPLQDDVGDMYDWTMDKLAEEGFEQYEISNWAHLSKGDTSRESQHNKQYWNNQPYIGLGAGAHGYVSGIRTANVLAPGAYIRRCLADKKRAFPRTQATVSAQKIKPATEMSETLLMGLRLVKDGVSGREFQSRFGKSLPETFQSEIQELEGYGLLEWAGEDSDRLRLTRKGCLLGNQVFRRFV